MILKIFQFHQKFIKWFLWLITFHLFAPQPTCFAASEMSIISALIQWSLQYGEKQLHRQLWTYTLNEILECRALRAWLQLPLPQVHLSAKITVFNYLHFRRIQKSRIGRVLHKNENKKWNLNSTYTSQQNVNFHLQSMPQSTYRPRELSSIYPSVSCIPVW